MRESQRHVYRVEQTKEGEFAVKLEINEVMETDKGSYKLIASNEKGEAISQVVQLVDIPEEERKSTVPELVKTLSDQTVVELKPFELHVTLKQNDRKCKIEWFKGSILVRETKEITTTFDGTNARLTFSTARQEHSSTYRVVVINETGKVESTCKITVVKKLVKKKDTQQETEEKIKVIKFFVVNREVGTYGILYSCTGILDYLNISRTSLTILLILYGRTTNLKIIRSFLII